MRHFCASAYIIDPETKKILLVKHKKFGKWVQPGGHIEHNEFPEEAAIRETYEETGIKIKLLGERFPREDDFIRPLGIQKNRTNTGVHIDFIYPAIPINHKELIISNESTNIGLFTREEIEKLNILPDIKITMDYILKHYFGKVD